MYSARINAGDREIFIGLDGSLSQPDLMISVQSPNSDAIPYGAIIVPGTYFLPFVEAILGAARATGLPLVGISSEPGTPAKAFTLAEKRLHDVNAYVKWTAAEEDTLKRLHAEGKTRKEISAFLGRNTGAISSRMIRLGLF